jgi:hypothetical protein
MSHFKVLNLTQAQRSNLKFPSVIMSILLLIVLIGTSCQKSGSDAKSSSGNTVNEQKLDATNNIVEATTSDEENFDMVMGNGEYADVSNAVSNTLSNANVSGKTITYFPSKNVYPYWKTIDYTNFTNANNDILNGKVIIKFFAPGEDTLTFTTYENYHVNSILVDNSSSITVLKIKNGAGQDLDVYKHNIYKKMSDTANGNMKEYTVNSKWTEINWQGGTAYEIAGHTEGRQTYNGIEAQNFKTDIDESNPVIKPSTCRYRVQGIIIAEINLAKVAKDQPNNLEEYLDYGNGDCDNEATLSINGGEPVVVTLPLRFWPLNL